jgi:hypothetical protein
MNKSSNNLISGFVAISILAVAGIYCHTAIQDLNRGSLPSHQTEKNRPASDKDNLSRMVLDAPRAPLRDDVAPPDDLTTMSSHGGIKDSEDVEASSHSKVKKPIVIEAMRPTLSTNH